jgi:hypothetical protein
MKTNMTRITAAVVDKRQLTMYKEDGSTIIIPQGDPRLRRIIEEITPQLIRQNWADVVIDNAPENSYAQFEQGGSGAVKFFRIAKAKLKNLFTEVVPVPVNITPVPVMSIGVVPTTTIPPADEAELDALLEEFDDQNPAHWPGPATEHVNTAGIYDVSEEDEALAAMEAAEAAIPPPPKLEQTMATINEIMAHAIPVQADTFHEKTVSQQGRIVEENGRTRDDTQDDDSEDTIIAVVDNKVIPGMEKIKSQFARAAKMGSTVGVENFLRRLASVIEQRQHSVDELLRFLERADLPIADDGSIIIYKVLERRGDKYVDCHSKKVDQFIGAFVCMDPKLVDHSRRNECSTGLHVARRGYISGFSGDVCVLAKLAPEDVIAVPHNEANKMRVCGYHIIAELTPVQHSLLKANKPLTGSIEGQELLAKAIAGQHVGRTHEVRITGAMGDGVITTAYAEPVPTEAPTEAPVPVAPVEALADVQEQLDPPIDPKEVVKVVDKAVLSRKEQAKVLYDQYLAGNEGALEILLTFKKQAKKGWDVLGIPDPTAKVKVNLPTKAIKVKTPKLFDKKPSPPPKIFNTPQVHDVDFGDEPADPQRQDEPLAEYTAKYTKAGQPVTDLYTGEVVGVTAGSPRERIAKLLAIGLPSTGVASAILAIKKQSKKSWAVLGVNEQLAADIIKMAGS